MLTDLDIMGSNFLVDPCCYQKAKDQHYGTNHCNETSNKPL